MPLIKLNLPNKSPRWTSINTDNIDEPEETDKDDGFAVNSHVPSNHLNWLLNYQYQWARIAAWQAISNWHVIELDAHALSTSKGIVAHPTTSAHALARWAIMHSGTVSEVHYNPSQFQFSGQAYSGLPGTIQARTLVFDSTRFIIGHTSGSNEIAYSTTAIAWTPTTTPLVGTVTGVAVKRPDSDYIIIGDSTGEIAFASDVTSSWTLATSDPNSLGDTTSIQAMHRITGDIWILIANSGHTYTSLNDGVDWIRTTDTPDTAGILTLGSSLDVNSDSGTVVAVSNAVDEGVAVSHDGGHSWASATLNINNKLLQGMNKVIYCGGELWVAVGDVMDDGETVGLIVSNDDGNTWTLPSFDFNQSSSMMREDIIDIACDGRCLIALGAGSNYIFKSDAIAGAYPND